MVFTRWLWLVPGTSDWLGHEPMTQRWPLDVRGSPLESFWKGFLLPVETCSLPSVAVWPLSYGP